MNIKCWWHGHETANHSDHFDGVKFIWVCRRCGAELNYADATNDTFWPRKARVKRFIGYWLLRKWWPEKCADCGERFKCDYSKHDHIPF